MSCRRAFGIGIQNIIWGGGLVQIQVPAQCQNHGCLQRTMHDMGGPKLAWNIAAQGTSKGHTHLTLEQQWLTVHHWGPIQLSPENGPENDFWKGYLSELLKRDYFCMRSSGQFSGQFSELHWITTQSYPTITTTDMNLTTSNTLGVCPLCHPVFFHNSLGTPRVYHSLSALLCWLHVAAIGKHHSTVGRLHFSSRTRIRPLSAPKGCAIPASISFFRRRCNIIILHLFRAQNMETGWS